MKLKAWLTDMRKAAHGLMKQTSSVARRTAGVLLPCALGLLLMRLFGTLTQTVSAAAGGGALVSLLSGLVVTPAAAGMITYASGASWEGRSAGLKDAAHLVRIRVKEIFLTGLAAGAIGFLTGGVASAVQSLLGIIPALIGWIPVLSAAVSAAVSLVGWLIETAADFIAHAALIIGMIVLTADGVSGRAQLDRALNIVKAGGQRLTIALAPAFILLLAAYGARDLAYLLNPACAYLMDIPAAAAAALSMTAVSVVFLQERDRQDGMKYHG